MAIEVAPVFAAVAVDVDVEDEVLAGKLEVAVVLLLGLVLFMIDAHDC